MSTKEHKWVRGIDFDRHNRSTFYCTECAALCLTSEQEYKSLLDQKGCTKANSDFDELYFIKSNVERGTWVMLSTCMTITGSWDLASTYTRKGYPDVSVFDSSDIEVDFTPYIQ